MGDGVHPGAILADNTLLAQSFAKGTIVLGRMKSFSLLYPPTAIHLIFIFAAPLCTVGKITFLLNHLPPSGVSRNDADSDRSDPQFPDRSQTAVTADDS